MGLKGRDYEVLKHLTRQAGFSDMQTLQLTWPSSPAPSELSPGRGLWGASFGVTVLGSLVLTFSESRSTRLNRHGRRVYKAMTPEKGTQASVWLSQAMLAMMPEREDALALARAIDALFPMAPGEGRRFERITEKALDSGGLPGYRRGFYEYGVAALAILVGDYGVEDLPLCRADELTRTARLATMWTYHFERLDENLTAASQTE